MSTGDAASPPPQVVVVGAGPTGCAAAILLGQRGVRVLVLDRWDDVYPQPRAVHLDDEVHRILARMHVADEFAAISRPGLGLQLEDGRHRVLGRFVRDLESSPHGYPQANMYDQPDLERVLRDRLAHLPTVELRGGVEVVSVESGVASSQVTWVETSTEERHSVHAPFLLGADGARSLVRESVGSRMQPLGQPQRWLVVDAEVGVELGHWQGVHQVCDPDRPSTYMRVGDTRHRWEFRLHDGEDAAQVDVQALLAPWTPASLAGRVDVVRTAEYTFRAEVADRWRSGRTFVLGDAAHLTPPFVGQGLGAGLRDAENLAWKVAGVLDGSLAADVLASYEAERAPHARAMVLLALGVGVTMTRGGRAGAAARGALLPAVSRALRRLDVVSSGVTPRLHASSAVTGARGDRLAGRLVPDVAGARRHDDEAQGRWSLVSARAVSPELARKVAERGGVVIQAATGDAWSRWLESAGRSAALVRPDACVMESGEPAVLVARLEAQVLPRR